MSLIRSETTTTWVRLGCPVVLSGFGIMNLVQKPQLLSALGPIELRDSRDSLCYTLLMTANKPETAVQGCAFFIWGHTLFLFMYSMRHKKGYTTIMTVTTKVAI